MRRAAKVDANQKTIVAAFRAHGCTVQSLAALGAGVPDLLVAFNGRNRLVEVKDGRRAKSARKLTEAQVAWQRMWRGDVHLVESVEDVAKLMSEWRFPNPYGVTSDDTARRAAWASLHTMGATGDTDASDYERPAKLGVAQFEAAVAREPEKWRKTTVRVADNFSLRDFIESKNREVRVTPNVIRARGGL